MRKTIIRLAAVVALAACGEVPTTPLAENRVTPAEGADQPQIPSPNSFALAMAGKPSTAALAAAIVEVNARSGGPFAVAAVKTQMVAALTDANYVGGALPKFTDSKFEHTKGYGKPWFNNPGGSRQKRATGCKYSLYSWWSVKNDADRAFRTGLIDKWCGLIADLTQWHWDNPIVGFVPWAPNSAIVEELKCAYLKHAFPKGGEVNASGCGLFVATGNPAAGWRVVTILGEVIATETVAGNVHLAGIYPSNFPRDVQPTDDTWYKISRCIAAPCRDGQPPGWRYTHIKVSDVPGRCRSEARRFGVTAKWEPWCAEIERKYRHYETYGRQP